MKKLFSTLLIALLSINVMQAQCPVTYTYSVDPANNGIVTFTVAPVNNYSYSWSFGNGSAGSSTTTTATFHTGTWQVCLTATDSIGHVTCSYCDSVTVVNTTPPGCSAYFTTYADTLNGGGLVHISNQSTGTALHYFWQYGDGTQDSTAHLSFTHTYNAPGHYYICLDVVNYTYGCNNTYCDSVYIQAPATCGSSIGYTNDATGNGVSLTSTITGSADTYSWSFGDGTYGHTANPHHIYSSAGYYTACLTVSSSTDPSCSYSTCEYFYAGAGASAPCSANFVIVHDSLNPYNYWLYNYSSGNNGNTVATYLWDFGDGTSSTLPYPQHTYTIGSGPYSVCLTIATDTMPVIACTATFCDSINPGHSLSQVTTISIINPLTLGVQQHNEIVESLENYPNPFAASTTISYSLNHASSIEIKLIDLIGNRVAVIESGNKMSGSYKTEFDASSVSSGIYLLQLRTDNKVFTKKLVIAK